PTLSKQVKFSEFVASFPEIANKNSIKLQPDNQYQFGIFLSKDSSKIGYFRLLFANRTSQTYYFPFKNPFPWEEAILHRDYGAIREHTATEIIQQFLCNYCVEEGQDFKNNGWDSIRLPPVSSKTVRFLIKKSDSTSFLFEPIPIIVEKIIEKKLQVLNESKEFMTYQNVLSDLKNHPKFDSLQKTKRFDLAVNAIEVLGYLTRTKHTISFTPEYLSIIWSAPSGPFDDYSIGLISWKQLKKVKFPNDSNWFSEIKRLQFPVWLVAINDAYPQTEEEMQFIQPLIMSGKWEYLPTHDRDKYLNVRD
ncbi:MAG: hypothetical protein NZ108_06470, partial [Bacteroidia bacterium]|nr:hypothetical protein [Bacteroidia bacterium]